MSRQHNQKVVHLAQQLGHVIVNPELAYVYLPHSGDNGEIKLAWKIDVT